MMDATERRLTANDAAQKYLIRSLLRMALGTMPPDMRTEVAKALRDGLARTDQFVGVAKDDDHAAERIADVAVRARQIAEKMIQEALDACQAVEADMNRPAE